MQDVHSLGKRYLNESVKLVERSYRGWTSVNAAGVSVRTRGYENGRVCCDTHVTEEAETLAMVYIYSLGVRYYCVASC
jgi:hypothetical protein